MPLYEFECEKCGHRFEVIRKFSDDPLKICPTCGGTIRKLFSSPAIQFKGKGWYVTDYGRGGQQPSKPSPAESEAKTESPKTAPAEKSGASSDTPSPKTSGGDSSSSPKGPAKSSE